MSTAIAAILPVFLTIALGVWLKARNFPGEGFWAPAERLTYFLLFPALIVTTLAKASLAGLQVVPMAASLVLSLLLASLLLIAAKPWLGLDGPRFTSLVQGATRMNTYICLAIAAGLWGSAGVTVAAIAIAVIVPTVNVICVAALAHWGGAATPTPLGLVKSFARNPLIVASVIGILLNASGLHLPPILGPMLEIMGRGALPLGLIAVGAALDFAAVRRDARQIAGAVALKLLAVPALAALVLWTLGVEGLTAAVAILFMASPTATSSYIMARQLGGDATLMAGILTAQTAAAMLTLPVVLTIAG